MILLRLERSGLIAGLALGAAAGAADVLHSGLRRTLAGRLVFAPEWFWWAAPWMNAVIIAGVTVIVLALLPRRLERYRDAIRFGLPLGLFVAAMLLLVPGLHRLAMLLLALGAGVRGGMFVARKRRADRALLWSLPVGLVLIPLAATVLFGLPRGAAAAGAPPARGGLPNIIIIVLDTVRAIELSLYGSSEETTPVLDALAAGGVTFERASSTAPWTLPSHVSLFTGRWAHETSASLLTPMENDVPTLAEALLALGYRTGGFSANVEYASAETGLARGFQRYDDHRWSLGRTIHLTRLSRILARNVSALSGAPRDLPGRVDADLVNRRFLHWVDRDRDRPYFAFLNYYDAHAPYFPPEAQWNRFVGQAPRRPLDNPHSDAGNAERVELQRRAYAGAINYIDGRIGELMTSLRAAGLLDNTIVVVTSDHGEEFSEHGVLGHGNTLYLPSVHVPLMVQWPGRIPPGCRVATPVSIRDVPATLLDLVDAPAGLPGTSLAGLWNGGAAIGPVYTWTQRAINQPADLPASRGPVAGVESWPYRLIVETHPLTAALYDRAADPGELTDLAPEPGARRVVSALLDSLARVDAIHSDADLIHRSRTVSEDHADPGMRAVADAPTGCE